MKDQTKDDFIIVGIGASAGGLAVLKKFVHALPEVTGMAYIIVQHLDPSHKSLLQELLSKDSKMPVANAEDNQVVKPNHIYVIPPNTFLELQDGAIKLTEPENTHGPRKAIDHLFRSLARECGDSCAGIILSGAGSDGTAGLRAIKAAGGLALAQDPETAEHASMPKSAIEADGVDKVCAVADMPDLLARFTQHPAIKDDQQQANGSNMAGTDESLEDIAAILKIHEDFNLSQYKPTTIQRRVARRMGLTNTPRYNDYLQKLREDESERKQLTKDLLINVTDFFRDFEAFDLLEKKIIPDILDKLDQDEDLRLWVAGCASGEEAYSLAILFSEALEKTRMKNNIRIFATDINEHAIKIARRGLYLDSIAGEVPHPYLEKYFIKIDNSHHYKIKGRVRDLISFAVQNVATHPPFNHMHLISCRNLLIYFNRQVQEKVLGAFYFALENHGYLFLGSSETLGNKADLFKTTSKKWRIYQKVPSRDKKRIMLEHLHIGGNDKRAKGESQNERRCHNSPRSERMRRSIMETATPPTLLVDDEGRVLFSHGQLEPYVNFPKGEPRYDLAQIIKPALRSRIRSALYKANKTKEPLTFHCTVDELEDKEKKHPVRVEINPISQPDYTDGYAYTVVFNKVETIPAGPKDNLTQYDENIVTAELEQELVETREELKNTIEELETSTEELKASHEEALSTNEELQSSNEELEASSEELRSLNEELSTVNAQLKDKIAELKRATDDAENFFASTDLPTIFFDLNLKIQRYTPAAEQLLKIGQHDIDREIASLGRDLVDASLTEECKEVLRNFQPKRKEIQNYEGRWFIRQITPYRTEDRHVEGVVLVFHDVTEIKNLSQRAEIREQQQAVVARLGLLALRGTKPEDLMHQAVRQVAHTLNAQYCKVLKYQPETHNLLLVAGIGWQEGLIGKATVPDDQYSQAGYTLLSQEPVITENLAQEKRFTGPTLLIEHGVASGMSCQIDHSNPPYGVLSVHSRILGKFTHDDANFLQSVANLLSTALRTQEAQERVLESEDKFRTMANTIPQLAWMTDETGYIFWYNQRWYDYTGTNLDDMKGWGWRKVHHPNHVNRVVQAIKHCFATGKAWEDTFPLRSKDGDYRWFLSRAKPIRNQAGEIVRWFGTNTDVTENLQQKEALRRSEERLRLAKNSSRLGLFEYDISHNTIEWEPLLREIWGVDPDEPITLETFFAGLHPDDRQKTQEAIEKSIDPNRDGHYQVTYRVINKKTQNTYWIKASGTVLFADKQPQRMIGLVDDVTEEKKLEVTLQDAVKQLQEIDANKNEFLSILGHELRNPLAALSGSVEVLQRKLPGEAKMLCVMQHGVNTMSKLLDDLLDLNRVSQNRIQLQTKIVDMGDVLNNVLHATETTYSKKDQHVILHADAKLQVIGDQTRLEQIFTNLVINACKYTPQGGKISLHTDHRDGQIHIKVSDTGVGLAEESIDKIFEPFYQIGQDDQAKQGLGIGLALCKKLVELHDGVITVHSEGKNKGSTFTVTLPAKAETPITTDAGDYQTPQVRPGLKVLLIEDNEGILLTMPMVLEALACEVETARTGQEGLDKIVCFQPDVMLVDIGLPDISGHEVAEKARGNGFDGLMVAISGYSHTEMREKSLFVGFDYHLAKPAKLDELAAVLATAVNRRGQIS